MIAGYYDPTNVAATAEPPNLLRKALLEIKFDTVKPASDPDIEGSDTVYFDSALVIDGARKNRTSFVDLRGNAVSVNFKKGAVKVFSNTLLFSGSMDSDGDGFLTMADYVLLKNRLDYQRQNSLPDTSLTLCYLTALGNFLSGDTLAIYTICAPPLTPTVSTFPVCMDMDKDGVLTATDLDLLQRCLKRGGVECCDPLLARCYYQSLLNHLIEQEKVPFHLDCPGP